MLTLTFAERKRFLEVYKEVKNSLFLTSSEVYDYLMVGKSD